MAHEWEDYWTDPNKPAHDYENRRRRRKCLKCGAIQTHCTEHLWMRVAYYFWDPKVGRCPADKKNKEKKQVNSDSQGNSLSGQPVRWNAKTGDLLKTRSAVYTVLDSFPNHVRLGRKTQFGDDIVTRTYYELNEVNAKYL